MSNVTISNKYLNIAGRRTFYLETVNKNLKENAPVLILIPGWLTSCYMFEHFMQNFGKYAKCYAPDLPGFGNSQTDFKTNHSIEYYANFVKIFIEKVVHKNHTISVLGYSVGGVITLKMLHKPNNINKAVIFSAPYNGPEYFKQIFGNRLQMVMVNSLLKIYKVAPVVVKLLEIPSIKHKFIYHTLAEGECDLKSQIQSLDLKHLIRIYNHSKDANMKAMIDIAVDLKDKNYTKILPKIETKTLVLGGEKEIVVYPQTSKSLAEGLPNATYKEIKGGTHYSLFTHEGIFVNEVKKFLIR